MSLSTSVSLSIAVELLPPQAPQIPAIPADDCHALTLIAAPGIRGARFELLLLLEDVQIISWTLGGSRALGLLGREVE
jgi:hypothetical protein